MGKGTAKTLLGTTGTTGFDVPGKRSTKRRIGIDAHFQVVPAVKSAQIDIQVGTLTAGDLA